MTTPASATPAATPAPTQAELADAADDDVAALDDGGDGDEAEPGEAGGPVGFDTESGPRVRRREVSEKTRELFKTVAQKMKEQIGDGDAEAMVPAITEDGAEVDDDVPADAAPPPAAKPAETASPPAATLDPRVVAEMEKVAISRAQLAAERDAFTKERATFAAETQSAERYLDKPADVVRELVKKWTGAATADEERDEIADLITLLSGEVLGIPLGPDVRSKLETRRVSKALKAYKASDEKREKALAEKQQKAEKDEAARVAVTSLGKDFEEHKATYPHLAASDNPGQILWDVIATHHERTGEQMTPDQAAKLANDYIQKQNSEWFARRSHLFNAAPAPAGGAKPDESAPQGDPSGIRRSRTLRNGNSAAPTPSQPDSGNGVFDNEAHRKKSLGKLRERIRPAE